MNVPETLSHETAAELLPWLANDSLADEEKSAVLEHARSCVICRREFDHLLRIQKTIADDADRMPLPEPDMRQINTKIDQLIDRRNSGRALLSRLQEIFADPWHVAFAAQSVALLVLAAVLIWPEDQQTGFTTLTQTQSLPDGHHIRAVFSPEMGDTELAALLDQFGLQVIDGPSKRGVYTLSGAGALTLADRDAIVIALRGESEVLFAQPAVTGSNR